MKYKKKLKAWNHYSFSILCQKKKKFISGQSENFLLLDSSKYLDFKLHR